MDSWSLENRSVVVQGRETVKDHSQMFWGNECELNVGMCKTCQDSILHVDTHRGPSLWKQTRSANQHQLFPVIGRSNSGTSGHDQNSCGNRDGTRLHESKAWVPDF